MFADDTNLFLSGKHLHEIELQLNIELKLITQWFQVNLLSLNVSKTSYIIFGNRLTHELNLTMQGTKLEQTLETKFLGVIINHKLSWKSHISNVCGKMSKTIGIIAKVRHLLPTEQVLMLYRTLVEPYMNYCCIVWGGINRSGCLDKIHKIQKRYCRLITFSDYRAHSAPLFMKLKIFTIYNMFRYQASLYMYRHMSGLLPRVLFKFQLNKEIHDHFTRQNLNLHNAFCRTRCRQLTFQPQGLRLWNSLPMDIKNLSFTGFKKALKIHVLETNIV